MFVIFRFADVMFPCRLCGRFWKGLNPSDPVSLLKLLLNYTLYRNDGRQAVKQS